MPGDSFDTVTHAVSNFEGTEESNLSVNSGEELEIIEGDAGDGWTLVKNKQGQEGFVPSSYLE